MTMFPTVPATRAGTFTGGDPCSLLEGMPVPGHPIRKSGPYKRQLRALDRAKRNPQKLWRVHRSLDKAVAGWLKRAQRIFHPGGDREVRSNRAQRFLSKYVFSKTPALVIGDDRFEPPSEVWATLIWTACRSGRRSEALRIARRAGRQEPIYAAFAALLLLDQGELDAARWQAMGRLVPEKGGFLSAFVAAELAKSTKRRRLLHALASRRVSTPDQRVAVALQAKRFARPPVSKPSPKPPQLPKEQP